MSEFPVARHLGFGPGSQPGEGDAELEYMVMPSGMSTYQQPLMPETEQTAGLQPGIALLEDVLLALREYRPGDTTRECVLSALDASNLEFVNQALGEGEVSVIFDGISPIRAQESVLAGVWRVQHFDTHNRVVRDSVQIGDVPAIVRSAIARTVRIPTHWNVSSEEIQNAPALLVELADRLTRYKPGDQAHCMNLTLLPLTQADLVLLGERLGVGPVTILSRGYGNCRIGSTGYANAWWVKYYNSQDALILNTIEVVDVPDVALAAPEDIVDSAERLDEILELYR